MASSNNTGTGFTNLQKYLNANQNNGLADTLASGINNASNTAAQDLTNQTTDFNTQSQNNSYNTDANAQKRQQVVGGISGGTYDPSSLTDQDYNQFAQWRTGGYAGPTSLSNEQRLQNEAGTAQQYGDSLNNQGGRFTLLQNFIGNANNNGYTPGQQNLDSLLIGNNSNLQQAQKKASDTNAQIRQGIQSATDTANNITQNNQQFGNQTKAMMGLDQNGNLLSTQDSNKNYTNPGAIQGLYNTINTRYNNNVNQQNTDYNNVVNDIQATKNGTGNLTPNELSRLGWSSNGMSTLGINDSQSPYVGMNTYGIDPLANLGSSSAYLQKGTAPTFQSVAQSPELARLAALTKLSGITNTYGDPNATGVGTYDPSKEYVFDPNHTFMGDVGNNKAAYEQIMNTPYNEATVGTDMHSLPDAYAWAQRIEADNASRGLTPDAANQAVLDKIINAYNQAQKDNPGTKL